MARLSCDCGNELPIPELEVGVERIILCDTCRLRTRVERRLDGKIHATRLAKPVLKVPCGCGTTFTAVAPDAGGTVHCPSCNRAFDVKKEVKAVPGPATAAAPERAAPARGRPAVVPASRPERAVSAETARDGGASRGALPPSKPEGSGSGERKPLPARGTTPFRAAAAAVDGPPRKAAAPAMDAWVGIAAAPGRNQDRAVWHPEAGIGCVADGVTSSPRSADAAEAVCRGASLLFAGGVDPEDALRMLSARLLALRTELVAKPLDGGEVAAAGGDPKAATAARMTSYQTTVVAFRVANRGPGRDRELSFVACGDSGLLALNGAGVLVAAGVMCTAEGPPAPDGGPVHVTFPPRSGATHVLPDASARAEWRETTVARDAWLLAATDGFFGGFEGSHELLDWLELHRADLEDPDRRPALLAERHACLKALTGGDDDVAFVIVPPA